MFRRCYDGELREHPRESEQLRALARHGPITPLFSARDETHNSAVVLRDLLLRVKRVRRPPETMRQERQEKYTTQRHQTAHNS